MIHLWTLNCASLRRPSHHVNLGAIALYHEGWELLGFVFEAGLQEVLGSSEVEKVELLL